ncbi:MAG TPA: hypothetical protein VK845_07530 [Gemmatimonadales bacterium]|nr:hypothetical protein [Gemmatimonadales bacterium]
MTDSRTLRKRTGALGLDQGGFALEATIFVLVLMSALTMVAVVGVVTATRTANYDYRYTQVSFAAEAGADAIMAQLEDAIHDGAITDAELAAIVPPSIPGFTFSAVNANRLGGVQVQSITDGPFAGLYALTQFIDIFSEVRDPIDNSAAAIVTAKAQSIPIFQFGVFYEKDLEITNGPPLDFEGWVHSNGNIYLSSSNAWYREVITTPNKVFHDRKDFHNILNGVFINDAVGTEVPLDFDSRSHPTPAAFMTESHAKFDDRLKTDAYGVDTLRVPLPNGFPPAEIVAPRRVTDGAIERRAKFSWKADWAITINLAGLNNPADNLCTVMASTRDGGEQVPSGIDCDTIFRFTWDAWFEGREKRYVDVLNIDLQQLFNWVGGNPSRMTQILHVTFTGTGYDPKGDGNLPVVRLVNGDQIGNPFTFSTDYPLYVQGHYNRTNWKPSALAGDAITMLSNAWNDAQHQCTTYNPAALTPATVCGGFVQRPAAATQVWAAVLAGHTPTPCDHELPGCPGGYADFYGGGVENFPRFLENWSGVTLTYRGSLVSLHFSAKAAGTWNGTYYTPPTRDWRFETRFHDPANLPPGTPVVGNVIHTAFRPVY